MTVALDRVVVPRKILLVEDEKNTRQMLARLLRNRGYRVALAESGSRAIMEARTGRIGVVVMDIVLDPNAMDGITAAQEIQRLYPLTSFIFVTAYASNADYRRRIRESGVRIGGLLEKPIREAELAELQEMIDAELEKLKVLSWLEEVRDLGGDPQEHLAGIRDSLSTRSFHDLLAEVGRWAGQLQAPTDEMRPLAGNVEAEAFVEILAEIDAVYSQIHSAVAAQRPGKELKEALRPLRRRLERLQERQADALERRVRSRLHFDPEKGRQLEEQAARLLAKK